jgi:hypothetical protein
MMTILQILGIGALCVEAGILGAAIVEIAPFAFEAFRPWKPS